MTVDANIHSIACHAICPQSIRRSVNKCRRSTEDRMNITDLP